MTATAARELPEFHQPDSADADGLMSHTRHEPALYKLTRTSDDLVTLMSQYFSSVNTDRLGEFKAITQAIATARSEIHDLRPVHMSQNDLPAAGAEMDAIILDTETATFTLMGAAERILELQTTDTVAKNAIDDEVMRIFEACSFQDITGQRVSKVIRLLDQIEQRMTRLVTSLGMSHDHAPAPLSAEEQRRRDLILHGPAIGGPETAQANIDEMFATPTPANATPASTAPDNTPNDQDAIDALFD